MLFVAAPNAHTYRLLIFKDLLQLAEKRFVHQRRGKIMKCFVHFVKLFFSHSTLHLHVVFREGQNHNKRNPL